MQKETITQPLGLHLTVEGKRLRRICEKNVRCIKIYYKWILHEIENVLIYQYQCTNQVATSCKLTMLLMVRKLVDTIRSQEFDVFENFFLVVTKHKANASTGAVFDYLCNQICKMFNITRCIRGCGNCEIGETVYLSKTFQVPFVIFYYGIIAAVLIGFALWAIFVNHIC